VFVGGGDIPGHRAPELIVGGAGKTGRRVTRLLNELGIATRPVSRSTTPSFDWTRPQGWAAALKVASRAYVIYQPDLAVDGAAEAIAEFSCQHGGSDVADRPNPAIPRLRANG
jgi:hypothetical protein